MNNKFPRKFKKKMSRYKVIPPARKIPSATPQEVKPCVDNGTLKLVTIEVDGKITSFKVTYRGQEKTFAVKNFNILAAWKEVEKFTADIR